MAGRILPDLVYELTSVSDPSLSPDGARLAFARSRVNKAAMESCSQIMMRPLPQGEAVQFTGGPRDSRPRFSPGGRLLAFLRPDSQGRQQVWLISTSGGEAHQLTTLPGGVVELEWSPNSRAIVVVSDVEPDHPSGGLAGGKAPRVRVVRRIRYRADTIGWRGDAFRHLFVVDVDGSTARQLTSGEGDDSSPAWSPDGTRIAFISERRPDRDLVSHTEAYVVLATGGQPELWSQGLSSVAALTWSPDGTQLAVIGSDDEQVGAGWQGWVFVLAPGQLPRRLTDDSIKPAAGFAPIIQPPEMRWASDGRILFVADARGESYLFQVPESGGPICSVTGGAVQFGAISFDEGARQAVVVAVPPGAAGDLSFINLQEGTQTQLTAYNQSYFGAHPPAQLKKLTLYRAGQEIESRLFLPPDFDPAQQYPLVVDIHGGPHGAFYDAFNPVQQVLATAGYLVLAVNPRGSSTYGAGFLKAVLRDWGGQDFQDILAAVDQACALPSVDASRLGITGYSYGGFMTSWAIGHDARFRAAVVGAPCINLVSMYGTSDIGVRFGEVQWGGMPGELMQDYRYHSPLTYAASVQTPVLLLHGEEDLRCPIEQSEQYFVALKRLGKEVEFVRFPGCSHMFLRAGPPPMREEYLARTLAWFDRHLGARSRTASEVRAVPADN